ncbi:unnamed protein product [Owenia fusiformis]|uniref:Uncharacterized protein n=1 Tax=Owenia fusiformis TaxID=6347 RepID=A0A8J1UCM9_OWEFU|nr:unnamed protein product [Owenia fusiformis]
MGVTEAQAALGPDWEGFPDSLILHIFHFLDAHTLLRAAQTCKTWNRVAIDELLWKDLFYCKWKIERGIKMAPHKNEWRKEYKRLHYHSPKVESEVLDSHKDQVLHVSFSHNGKMFATCSKDGFIKVWNATYPTRIKYSEDLRGLTWKYTQFSQFNESDTLLLVSGVHFGSNSTSGEIAVFSLTDSFTLQSRVSNKPYDIFGTWFNDNHLLSGNLHWQGHLSSATVLWLNKAYQETESEVESVVMQLLKFYNVNASSIRTIMVANCYEPQFDNDVPQATVEQVKPDIDEVQDEEDKYAAIVSSPSGVQKMQIFDDHQGMHFLEVDADDRHLVNIHGTIEYNTEYRSAETKMEQNYNEHKTEVKNAKLRKAARQDYLLRNEHKRPRQESGTSDVDMKQARSDSKEDEPVLFSLNPDDNGGEIQKSSVPMDTNVSKCSTQSSSSDTRNLSMPNEPNESQLNSFTLPKHSYDQSQQMRSTEVSRTSTAKSDANADNMTVIPVAAGDMAECSKSCSEPCSRIQADSASCNVAFSSDTATQIISSCSSSDSCLSDSSNCYLNPAKSLKLLKSQDKYLIFTTGVKTCTPHQIGVKRMSPDKLDLKLDRKQKNILPDVEGNQQGLGAGPDHYDDIDHLIDLHGHIIGMSLSPDHRYLYVNSRTWPKGYEIEDPLYPPPIAQEIDIHVIDLLTMKEVGTMFRAHKAYTPNDECFFIFLDVCDEYVASGAEDKHGYIWDRHYGICLAKFPHDNVVNSVAFNPKDPETLVTVSDDFTVKIWRSLNREKELKKSCKTQQTEHVIPASRAHRRLRGMHAWEKDT